MKSFTYSASALLVLAGSAFAKNPTPMFNSVLSPASGFTNPTGDEGSRSGPVIAVVPVQGVPSVDALGDPDNFVGFLNIGAGNAVNGIGWDLRITTIGFSWVREATILVSDSTGQADPEGVFVSFSNTAAPGDEFTSSNGILKLANYGLLPIAAGPDGLIRIEFFETYVDNPNSADAILNGSLFFQLTVPTPASAGLLGLAGVGLLGRKRR